MPPTIIDGSAWTRHVTLPGPNQPGSPGGSLYCSPGRPWLPGPPPSIDPLTADRSRADTRLNTGSDPSDVSGEVSDSMPPCYERPHPPSPRPADERSRLAVVSRGVGSCGGG